MGRRCAYLFGADGARSRVAQRTGLGQVRDNLYGVERVRRPAGVAGRCTALLRQQALRTGYIGWVAQNPTGLQVGLALRHDPNRYGRRISMASSTTCAMWSAFRLRRVPRHPRRLGPVRPAGWALHRPTRDPDRRRGRHRLAAVRRRHPLLVAARLGAARRFPAICVGKGRKRKRVARQVAPAFRGKHLLRWAMDHLQADWPLNALLHTAATRRIAEQVYFHRRGLRT